MGNVSATVPGDIKGDSYSLVLAKKRVVHTLEICYIFTNICERAVAMPKQGSQILAEVLN